MIIESSDKFSLVCPHCSYKNGEWFISKIKLPTSKLVTCEKCKERFVFDVTYSLNINPLKIVKP